MDIKICKAFDESLNESLIGIIISNSTDKNKISKIKIRPVILKGKFCFQVSEYVDVKIFHKNYTKEELIDKLPDWFEGLLKQAEIKTKENLITILISKKGKVTINRKANKSKGNNVDGNKVDEQINLEQYQHNKSKKYLITEGTVLPFLVDLGVMTTEGKIVKAKSDKFRQINRFLEFIEDILPYLDKNRELTILDFGCGKSYLTFVMYHYLRIMKGYHINVIGLDLKTDVIEHCNRLIDKYGYDNLRFIQGDIASYDGTDKVDMVVSLHACDTATDHALYKALSWGARVILSVPCCQHELNAQINNEVLEPILKYGIIKERVAALITDALRAELLETMGYRVQLLEFIDMEHTPKNILIRAVKRDQAERGLTGRENRLKQCMDFLGVTPSLNSLIQVGKGKDGE